MHDLSTRTTENENRTRELALRLVRTAEDIAETFERAAAMHDDFASDPQHPLFPDAAAHAVHARQWAAHERSEADRFRDRVATLFAQPR